MKKILIHPKARQWVVPLPEGIMVDLRAERSLPEFEIPAGKQTLRDQVAESYTGYNGMVCPVTFDERIDPREIVIIDDRISGYLKKTPSVNAANRIPLMLHNLRFVNQPWLVSVGGVSSISDRYRIFGEVHSNLRYWVLVRNHREKVVTIPEELLTSKQAKLRRPLRPNGAASLRQLGLTPPRIKASFQYLSFRRCEREDGRYAYEGDVNFIHVWDSPLTIREVLSAFGAERLRHSSLFFVAQTEEGISALKKSGERLWPNLLELLSRDLFRLS